MCMTFFNVDISFEMTCIKRETKNSSEIKNKDFTRVKIKISEYSLHLY